jgi:putative transposase
MVINRAHTGSSIAAFSIRRHWHSGTTRRPGTLWEGRYRATAIDGEAYLLACQRYIELNPVRARMVADAAAYRWSSHAAHAAGAADPLVRPHPLYLALGPAAAERQAAYRALFAIALDEGFIVELRAATNGGWALGDERFRRQIAAALGRRVAPLPRGRRKRDTPEPEQATLIQSRLFSVSLQGCTPPTRLDRNR